MIFTNQHNRASCLSSIKICCQLLLDFLYTVKPVLSGHSKNDKTNILTKNGSIMKSERIAKCSLEHSTILLNCIKSNNWS